MRPAVNIDVMTTSSAPAMSRSRYLSGPWGPWIQFGTLGGDAYWDRTIHPATIVNPVQPDGSRGRSPWSHRFSHTSVLHKAIEVTEITPWGDAYERKLLAPVLPDSGNLRRALALAAPVIVGGSFPYEAEARARTQFLSKLSGSKADLGVALAELRQTVDLAGSLAKDLINGIDSAVRAGAGLPKRVVREILNFGKIPPKRVGEASRAYNRRVSRERAVLRKWLEYQFGLKPLVNDIDEIGRGLSDTLFERQLPMRLTITSGARVIDYNSGRDAFGAIAGYEVYCRGSTEVGCHISADYHIPLTAGRTWNQWGMLNPAVVAWEVTQFSWMVDYVFQVGDWLESLTAATGAIPLGGSMSLIAKLQSLETRLVPTSARYGIKTPNGWNSVGIGNCGRFERNMIGDVSPAYRPTVRNKVNLTRLANVLSVLALKAKLH